MTQLGRLEMIQRGFSFVLLGGLVVSRAQEGPCASQSKAADADQQKFADCVSNAEKWREAALAGYTAREVYMVYRRRNPDVAASRTVSVVHASGQGKTYTEIARSGSSQIQNFLLDRLISEQANLSKPENRGKALITTENYNMSVKCNETISGRECVRIGIVPKQSSNVLIVGDVLIDSHSCHLVRVEGKLSKSPSFFAGAPYVTRDYSDRENFFLATQATSVADSFFLGETKVVITYTYQRIVAAAQKGT